MGWIKRPVRTGWHDASELLSNGWTGKVYLARSGDIVMLRLHAVSAASATTGEILTLPLGLRPSTLGVSVERPLLHTTAPVIRRGYFAGATRATLTVTGYTAADQLYGDIRFDTTDAPPVTVPGVKL